MVQHTGQISDEDNKLLDKLDLLLKTTSQQKGGLIPSLQGTQALFGYVPQFAMARISHKLHIPMNTVYGVVTFYSFFSRVPRGKHIIRVCMGTACYIRGAQQVLESFENRLKIKVGQTTEDRMFTLEVARCFGACGLAPAVSINDKVYKNVAPSRVGKIVDSYYPKTAGKGASA